MLRLEKVTGRNVWDILKLRVRDEQINFVAGMISALLRLTLPLQAAATRSPLVFMRIKCP